MLHFHLMIAIQVELHENLLNECLVRDAISQLHHLSVLLLAVEQFIEQMALHLLRHIYH